MDCHAVPVVAVISLATAIASALWIALDECFHPQRMKIMNLVWPLTALYGGVVALWAYYRIGRNTEKRADHRAHRSALQSYALATTHCGAGCTLGDLTAEWATYFIPTLLTILGYPALFSHKLFAGWVLDDTVPEIL